MNMFLLFKFCQDYDKISLHFVQRNDRAALKSLNFNNYSPFGNNVL